MDNFFDPAPIASPNLPQDDPLRAWASQLQNDPELPNLMATDPQKAIERMIEMGVPPPPQGALPYTDGMGAENTVPNRHPKGAPPGVYGGAEPQTPYPAAGDPMTAGDRKPSIAERVAGVFRLDPGAMDRWRQSTPLPSQTAEPPLPAGPARAVASASLPKNDVPEFDPAPAESVPMPRARPAEAPVGASDMSSQKKPSASDALANFGKSLQGVKPVPPPAPNFVGTPSVRSPTPVSGGNLQNLLSLVGQPPPSPLALTLGRLLATGKA